MPEPSILDTSALEALIADIADDYAQQRRRGVVVDVEQYAQRYPEHATLIRQILSSLEWLDRSGAGRGGDSPEATGSGETGRLGDFRLVREVGRGGMGVVYEAVQLSLGRQVAVKVLPFAAGLDPRQLQRFLNEARVAAQLHHANIVPVFAVGCEHGVHFFAMQFIEGTNLADLLGLLRQRSTPTPGEVDSEQNEERKRSEPDFWSGERSAMTKNRSEPDFWSGKRSAMTETAPSPESAATDEGRHDATTEQPTLPAWLPDRRDRARWVARLGMQAALALEHAHQQGVVHRDIKPSNLLLDADGRLWVSDFGLARSGTNVSLTATGDIVGTLRYMSPEQTFGKPVLVDHRTDIYALGLTLYELLTLVPAFPAGDRLGLLRQISQQEPTPPRRLDPSIPRDLETIVVKAMAKAPEQRYASAQDLADDLGRFLKDRPILARPPSLPQRARAWARRHRSLAISLAVLACLLVTGSVCASIAYAFQQRRYAQELEESATAAQRAKKGQEEEYYRALVSGASALRLGRVPGYRCEAWASLQKAASLDVSCKDLRAIRAEMVACLGDPLGLDPVVPPRYQPRPLPALSVAQEQFLKGHSRVGATDKIKWAISPNGRWLAVCPSPSEVVVFGDPPTIPAPHGSSPLGIIDKLAFTPDNEMLAAISDQGLTVWSISERTSRPTALTLFAVVRSGNLHDIAIQPGGRLLATLGRKIELWSLTTNRLLLSLPATADRIDFSADGKLLLAIGSGGKVRSAWPVADTPEKVSLAGHHQGVPAVSFSPDGKLLASVCQDQTVKLWDVRTQALRHTCRGHFRAIESLSFNPDGTALATGDCCGFVYLWDVDSGKPIPHIDYERRSQVSWKPGRIWRLSFDRSGQLLAGGGESGVFVWKVARKGDRIGVIETHRFDLPGVIDLALRPQGDAVVALNREGRLMLLSLGKEKSRTLPYRARTDVRSLAFDPQGRRFTFVTIQGALATCDLGDDSCRPTRQPASHLALDPTGRWVATVVSGHGVAIYDLKEDKEWLRLPADSSDIWGLAWSPDGARLAVGQSNGGVAIWNLEEVRACLAPLGIKLPSTAR